jgi:phosphatidate cytidylyltransferase
VPLHDAAGDGQPEAGAGLRAHAGVLGAEELLEQPLLVLLGDADPVVAAAQLGQEAATRRLRRRPVARAISRSFSWRAFGIGAGAAALVGLLLSWTTPFTPLAATAMAAIAGAAGTFGEFVMKALKRDAGVRSWSGASSVTGAVGLLDRVAPLCFAAPVFFHSVRGYFGI